MEISIITRLFSHSGRRKSSPTQFVTYVIEGCEQAYSGGVLVLIGLDFARDRSSTFMPQNYAQISTSAFVAFLVGAGTLSDRLAGPPRNPL